MTRDNTIPLKYEGAIGTAGNFQSPVSMAHEIREDNVKCKQMQYVYFRGRFQIQRYGAIIQFMFRTVYELNTYAI